MVGVGAGSGRIEHEARGRRPLDAVLVVEIHPAVLRGKGAGASMDGQCGDRLR